ncbi:MULTISPECIES: site-2 protease family protein [Clostridium]|uniref:Peptidase family M50 n=3 Tax=Clostridium TaxID=1485 RepID=D8GIU8_CLOLD|nr:MULTISPECIES: site-2 protease family protein [Clostridium]ADK15023.1 putative membrane peptidase [Clostridium ljungdahlii DSM 13528]AGY74275.1 site-2 protease family protein [Clostridium autoethanogenum DSM 10061]ALU34466.1 Membrane metallo-peptidase (Zn dependent) M50 family [Clostridium autoethanogenum DSM 10061]OAA87684.1 Peptidase family M50 [Clostridium ljungdahlii DSM 13528]OVY51186.1 Peptidase family M50 [Clostridium autoethanogenum]
MFGMTKSKNENQSVNNLYTEIKGDNVPYTTDANEEFTENSNVRPPILKKMKSKKSKIGILGIVGAFLLKFKGALIFLAKFKFLFVLLKLSKVFYTLGSMTLAIFIYASIYGVVFGVGFILLLFAHEMGHYAAAKKIHLPISTPIFIPFVGALISMKEMPKTAKDEAFMAAAGPVGGSIAALLCIPIYLLTHNNVFLALAYTGFFMNLFNLVPIHPLDGGRIATAITPKLWFIGIPVFALACIKFFNPVLIIFLILGIVELYKYYKNPKKEYYEMKTSTRIVFTLVYFGLVAILGASSEYIHAFIPLNYQ